MRLKDAMDIIESNYKEGKLVVIKDTKNHEFSLVKEYDNGFSTEEAMYAFETAIKSMFVLNDTKRIRSIELVERYKYDKLRRCCIVWI